MPSFRALPCVLALCVLLLAPAWSHACCGSVAAASAASSASAPAVSCPCCKPRKQAKPPLAPVPMPPAPVCRGAVVQVHLVPPTSAPGPTPTQPVPQTPGDAHPDQQLRRWSFYGAGSLAAAGLALLLLWLLSMVLPGRGRVHLDERYFFGGRSGSWEASRALTLLACSGALMALATVLVLGLLLPAQPQAAKNAEPAKSAPAGTRGKA